VVNNPINHAKSVHKMRSSSIQANS